MADYLMRVPDLGEGIAEVEVVAWQVAVGDAVNVDQPLVDLMTDKATVEIPSPVAGQVLSLGGEAGQMLAVGAELIRIATAAGAEAADADLSAPRNEDSAADGHGAVASTEPATADSEQAERRLQPAAPTKVLAAPAVRKRARQLGIDLHALQGCGADGRILHENLDAVLLQRAGAGRPTAAARLRAVLPADGEVLAVTGLRRQIARRLEQGRARVAQFSYVEEVDVTALEALREQLNLEHAAERERLTLLPFVIRALVLALRDHPQLNVHFDDEQERLIRFTAVHLGIAIHTADGLMAPVLRDVDQLDLWACAEALRALAETTRRGEAGREQLVGATISLTSLGALGGIVSTPLVVPPQVAIVGINRIVERPQLRDGQLRVQKTMNLSSSFDHRIIDGMDAAQFIHSMRKRLETPALLFADQISP